MSIRVKLMDEIVQIITKLNAESHSQSMLGRYDLARYAEDADIPDEVVTRLARVAARK